MPHILEALRLHIGARAHRLLVGVRARTGDIHLVHHSNT
jgi:hypothetical protein